MYQAKFVKRPSHLFLSSLINVMTSTRSEGLERRKGVNKELVEPMKMAEKDKCYQCGQTANMENKNKVTRQWMQEG